VEVCSLQAVSLLDEYNPSETLKMWITNVSKPALDDYDLHSHDAVTQRWVTVSHTAGRRLWNNLLVEFQQRFQQ